MAPLRRPFARRAFTLIELLVVIAIIAILTAILLPVFASVRENSRQSVSISNLKDIQQKMEQFKLDNHKYPDVLFGYADGQGDMKGALGRAQTAGTAALYFPGLYPAYIKDPAEFQDPNNTAVDDNSPVNLLHTAQLSVNIIAPCNATNDNLLAGRSSTATSPCSSAASGAGSAVQSSRAFYTQDAYDSNPAVTGENTVDPNTVVVRYQAAHEGTACSGTNNPVGCDPSVTSDTNYTHQLRWQNPPAETFVTCSTYHVKYADKVLVLFESGAVKKLTGEEFATGVQGQTNGEPANFWKLTP